MSKVKVCFWSLKNHLISVFIPVNLSVNLVHVILKLSHFGFLCIMVSSETT
jgi:hypothetical protein